MKNPRRLRLGNVKAMVRVAESARTNSEPARKEISSTNVSARATPVSSIADPAQMRQLLAEFCRLLGQQAGQKQPRRDHGNDRTDARSEVEPGLPPRLRQTLIRLLSGDSEKQIATLLHLSPHTVHAYVKMLHKHYAVSSRGELLARFINRSPNS